jgi:Winged helix DNA-binding domain
LETNSNLISNVRLINQKIALSEFKTAKEIVHWMGAIQAQDYSMSKWAIGLRLNESSDDEIISSINKGDILRLHVLRPTWHFISSDDVYWMLQLSAPKIKSSLKSRHKELGLTESIIVKTTAIIEKTLSGGISLTRGELADEFHKAGIRTDANRLSHLLFHAEMDGIVCNGPVKSNKLTYSLLSERVPHKKNLLRDEALTELAKRYFTSRCPATLEDFIWWSNLPAKDAQKAVELIKSEFRPEKIGEVRYLLPDSFSGEVQESVSLHLLPAYDEFLISYKDKRSSLALVYNKRTVSDNGIFYPTIVIDGQVAGIWKRTIQKNNVIIEITLFQKPGLRVTKQIEKKASLFGQFVKKEIKITQKTIT